MSKQIIGSWVEETQLKMGNNTKNKARPPRTSTCTWHCSTMCQKLNLFSIYILSIIPKTRAGDLSPVWKSRNISSWSTALLQNSWCCWSTILVRRPRQVLIPPKDVRVQQHWYSYSYTCTPVCSFSYSYHIYTRYQVKSARSSIVPFLCPFVRCSLDSTGCYAAGSGCSCTECVSRESYVWYEFVYLPDSEKWQRLVTGIENKQPIVVMRSRPWCPRTHL